MTSFTWLKHQAIMKAFLGIRWNFSEGCKIGWNFYFESSANIISDYFPSESQTTLKIKREKLISDIFQLKNFLEGSI